jgi:hypothetical protein
LRANLEVLVKNVAISPKFGAGEIDARKIAIPAQGNEQQEDKSQKRDESFHAREPVGDAKRISGSMWCF